MAMIRIENASRGGRVLHELPKKDKDGNVKPPTFGKRDWHVPGGKAQNGKVVENGVLEVPSEIVDELKANDPVVRGWFATGDLIDPRGKDAPSASKAVLEADAKAAAEAEQARAAAKTK